MRSSRGRQPDKISASAASRAAARSCVSVFPVQLTNGHAPAVDNTLWSGAVADPAKNDKDTVAIRAFNDAAHADARVDLSLLPIGDGLTLALKR